MDPKVVAHYGGDISLANVQPGKRERLIAKWGEHASIASDSNGAGRRGADDGAGRPSLEASEPNDGDAVAHRCPGCDYEYSAATGAPREGFPPGTAWSEVPPDWRCPDCGVREARDFAPVVPAATVGA
jgi:alkane 1-monooxygenase